MRTMDEVSLDFKHQKVKLRREDNTWELKGIHHGTMEIMLEDRMDRTVYQMSKGWEIYACRADHSESIKKQDSIHPDMAALCLEFAKKIEKPQGLPQEEPMIIKFHW